MIGQRVHATAGLTLRHWSIDSGKFVGGFQKPAPALLYAEKADDGQLFRPLSKLARVKSEVARRVS
jgi:hypothetical protein